MMTNAYLRAWAEANYNVGGETGMAARSVLRLLDTLPTDREREALELTQVALHRLFGGPR